MIKRTKKSASAQASENQTIVQLPLSKLELMANLQASVYQFAVDMGLTVIYELLTDDVTRLCGKRYSRGNGEQYRECYRHGSQAGVVLLGGAKHKITKPRVRGKHDGGEVELPHYELLQGRELLSEECVKKMVLGVSTRNYGEVINAATESFGIGKSSVSKQFIKGSKKALQTLDQRDFSEKRMVVIMIDGIEFAGEVVVSAVGIDEEGRKHILGLRHGATENAEVVGSMLSELVEQGISTTQPTLFVVDGSKALTKAIKKFWGNNAMLQRCTLHKRRNILGHLNEEHKQTAAKLYDAALAETDVHHARKKLKTLLAYLKRVAPSAANSLLEAWDHLLTIHQLGIPQLLSKSLYSTNIIESAFSVARQACRNVKRWRQGDMRLRWAAAGLLHAESRFNRIDGYKHMGLLIAKIDSEIGKAKGIDQDTIAA